VRQLGQPNLRTKRPLPEYKIQPGRASAISPDPYESPIVSSRDWDATRSHQGPGGATPYISSCADDPHAPGRRTFRGHAPGGRRRLRNFPQSGLPRPGVQIHTLGKANLRAVSDPERENLFPWQKAILPRITGAWANTREGSEHSVLR